VEFANITNINQNGGVKPPQSRRLGNADRLNEQSRGGDHFRNMIGDWHVLSS